MSTLLGRAFWTVADWPLALGWYAYSRVVGRTATISVEGPVPPSQAIFVNFHHYQPLMPVVHGGRGRWILVSPAPPLKPIARYIRWMDMGIVRGASGHGGREGFRALAETLSKGRSVVLAVDGPAGPAYRVKRGCVELARQTGVPIVPVAYRCARGFELPLRWDRALFGTPFDRVVVRYGAPMDVSHLPMEEGLSVVEGGLRALDEELRKAPLPPLEPAGAGPSHGQ